MRIAKIGALLFLLSLGLMTTSSTRADVVLNFDLDFVNISGNPGQSLEIPSGQLVGTLTAIQANFVMTAKTSDVWRSDLAVFISNQGTIQPAANGGAGLFQVGGFSGTWGATERRVWGTGDDELLDTPLIATINLNTPIVFNGNASDPNIFVANLYNGDHTSSYNGSFTLVGLSAVPEPNSLTLLALAGLTFVAKRRRR